MGADRVLARDGRPELALLRERQLSDVGEAVAELCRELLPVERRALEEVGQLPAVALVVADELLVPRQPLDIRVRSRPPPPPPRRAGARRDALALPRDGRAGPRPGRGSGRPSRPTRGIRDRASPPRSASRRSWSVACPRSRPRRRGAAARAPGATR